MRKSKVEVVKSIVLSILVILSIYLYYKVYFDYRVEDIVKAIDIYQNSQSDQQLLKKSRKILVSPKEMYLNISKNVAVRILSNQSQYSQVVSKFIEGMEKSLVKKEFEISQRNISANFFKQRRVLILSYGYEIDFNTFVYELTKRNIGNLVQDFKFDKIFIEENSKGTVLYFFNSKEQRAAILRFSPFGFLPLENLIEKDLKLVYSWSDSLGFTEIANKDILIPVEFSDVHFSEINTRESSYKKELIIRRLFPDTILTRRNILQNGDVIITDERRTLKLKNDGSFVFEYSENGFGERVDSISDALMFYLKTFYTEEDLRICKLELQKEGDFKIYLMTRANGIDVVAGEGEFCAKIEVQGGRLQKISGYLFDILKVRTSQINVDGIVAIDTIKERKGDIFIEEIDLEYISGGASSYPYWKIKTQSGVVYVETRK
uniref:Regulatory protein YycH domain-containing protein n=1 Tax=Caldicellulosiruptor owensensis TaxID=55205 RepID=A0A7C5Z9K3_9FIRM